MVDTTTAPPTLITSFTEYLIFSYDNAGCVGVPEFLEDYKNLTYLSKHFTTWRSKTETKNFCKLVLNRLISFLNVFPGENGLKILFYSFQDEVDRETLKTFLFYMGIRPGRLVIDERYEYEIDVEEIDLNPELLDRIIKEVG